MTRASVHEQEEEMLNRVVDSRIIDKLLAEQPQ